MSEWDKNTGIVDAPFKMVCYTPYNTILRMYVCSGVSSSECKLFLVCSAIFSSWLHMVVFLCRYACVSLTPILVYGSAHDVSYFGGVSFYFRCVFFLFTGSEMRPSKIDGIGSSSTHATNFYYIWLILVAVKKIHIWI